MTTTCIWCVDSPAQTPTFLTSEHVFPRALGGSVTFQDGEVCDLHNSVLSTLEGELATQGLEALARVAFGPDGRSVKQMRKDERKGQLIGPAARRLEGRGEQFIVQNGNALDVLTSLVARDGKEGFAPHLLPALVVVNPNAAEGDFQVECVGSDENELRRLVRKIGTEEPSIQIVDGADLPKDSSYHPRLELDERGRLLARGLCEETTLRAAEVLKKAVLDGRVDLGPAPLEVATLERSVALRQKVKMDQILRAIGKTVVNMVAFTYGRQAAQSSALAALRGFVLSGTGASPINFGSPTETSGRNPREHTIRIEGSDRKLTIELVLYGSTRFYILLERPDEVTVGARTFSVVPGAPPGPRETTSNPERVL